MKRETVRTHTRRIITAALCVILTAAMTLGGSASAAEALQWALEPTSGYKAISHADGDFWIVVDYADRVGLITSEGKTVVECSEAEESVKNYEQCVQCGYNMDLIVGNFTVINESLVSIKRGTKYGVIDSEQNVIIPFEYDTYIERYDFGEKMLLKAKKDGKYGFIDTQNKAVFPFIYDDISYLRVSYQYDLCLRHTSFDNNAFSICIDGKYGAMDINGNIVVSPVYASLERINHCDKKYFLASQNGKYGLLDYNGNVLTDIIYDQIDYYLNSYDFKTTINELNGVIDANGKTILQPKYKDIVNDIQNETHRYAVSLDGTYYGIADRSGNLIVPIQYMMKIEADRGYYYVVGSNNSYYIVMNSADYRYRKFGLIDKSGRTVLSPEYAHIDVLGENVIIATKDLINGNHETVIIDANGNALEDLRQYDSIRDYNGFYYYETCKFLITSSNNKYGLLNEYGNVILDCKYDSIEIKNDYIIAKLNGKYGLLNSIGWEMLPFIYDSIWFNSDTTLRLSTNGYVGTVDIYGNIIVPYKKSNEVSPGLFRIEQNEKYGIIDENGNTVIPAVYSQVWVLDNGLIEVTDKDNFGFYDYSGNVVLPCIYKYYSYSVTVGNKTYYVICNENKPGNIADVIYDSTSIAVIECRCTVSEYDYYIYSAHDEDSYTDFGFTDGNSIAILRLYAGAGSVINKVLHTDIMCKIGGKAIRSYNIDGNTAIVAEDLLNYGFGVAWDGEARTLSVTKGSGEALGKGDIPKDTAEVGSYAMDVYATDITTYVDGKKVKGYNIGGYTIIFVDDLAAFGNVSWNGDAREITFEFAK